MLSKSELKGSFLFGDIILIHGCMFYRYTKGEVFSRLASGKCGYSKSILTVDDLFWYIDRDKITEYLPNYVSPDDRSVRYVD